MKQLRKLAATLAAIAFIPGSAPAALADTEASASASADDTPASVSESRQRRVEHAWVAEQRLAARRERR